MTVFLSTLSLRRATVAKRTADIRPEFLSTLSLRRATGGVNLFGFKRIISIHALLAESDSWISSIKKRTPAFLSTLSLRRATDQATNTHRERQISIHALLAESDNINSSVTTADKISIHALLAESDRPQPPQGKSSNKFLSTLSLRRATHYDNYNLHCVEISIHALLAESDPD